MATTDSGTANYRGDLYLIGANQTPFFSMIGGMNGGKRSANFTFPLAQPWALNAASQNVQSETTAASAGTPETYTRGQDTNQCQIMKYDAKVTFKKQSTYGTIAGGINTLDGQPVNDELAFQKAAALMQMAKDIEYSFLQGTGVAESAVGTEVATQGIVGACSTNTEAEGDAALEKSMINELLREMATNGSVFEQPVIFANAFQKQKLTDIYDYVPADRNYGGSNIRTIETDFATMGVVYAPQMPTDTLLIADLAHCSPVFVPVTWSGERAFYDPINGADVLWVPVAVTAAAYGGFFYTQIGLDYGPEEYHGTLTGLATS